MRRLEATTVTDLLASWGRGDTEARDRLIPLVYGELRAVAQSQMNRERPEHTLQATALVHEAYLRLADKNRPRWKSRSHFFAVAALLMRRILTDHSRRVAAQRRGGGMLQIAFDEVGHLVSSTAIGLPRLDESLSSLERLDPRKAQIVELRYFGGLSIDEVAEVLGLGRATVIRDWRFARSWLLDQLDRPASSNGSA